MELNKPNNSLCSRHLDQPLNKNSFCNQPINKSKNPDQSKTIKTASILLPCEHDHTYAKKKVGQTLVKKNTQKGKMQKKVALENSKHRVFAENGINLGLKANFNNLKFDTLNVGGLKSKIKFEDFQEEINSFDIVCLLEIKMDKNDDSVFEKEFEQFKVFTNVDEEYQNSPRGGIMILVKNFFLENIKLIPKTNNLALSIEINSKILNLTENVVVSAIYIPPVGSLYSGEEDFDILDTMINEMQSTYKNIILLGDFNVMTHERLDYLVVMENDPLYQLGIFDQKLVSTARKNKGKHAVDSAGNKLLNLCKVHNLQIVNGRVGKDKGLGKYTTKNDSVLDYMLAPPALFNEIYDFEILEFNPILSDVHCPIVFNTPSEIKDSKPLCNAILVQKIKWEGSKTVCLLIT